MLPILVEYRQHDADIQDMYSRALDLKQALSKKSHFLLGPRATGKSWLIQNQLGKKAQVFDLLNLTVFERFLKRPGAFAEEVNREWVVIDEIQKLPQLLDEVHRLIEERKIRFLLTGSSARKLKRGGANLLGGRARTLHMFPLTFSEIDGFDLKRYCNFGGLPMIYPSSDGWKDLQDYVQLYLKEEIIAEAAVRRVDHYARFLDVIGLRSGEELNYQGVASDSGVPPRTVANFVEILKDTLLAFEMEPYRNTRNKKSVSKSKIYLFDVGVANYLAGREKIHTRSEAFGKAFEHFILQEVRAYIGYRQIDVPMRYWRTTGSQDEVDCVLGDALAIEIKSTDAIQPRHLSGLKKLHQDKPMKTRLLVSRDPIVRKIDGVEALGYQDFLTRLWNDDLPL